MDSIKTLILLVLSTLSVSQSSNTMPPSFVEVCSLILDLDVELRYYSSQNFVGQPIDGYQANTLILTKKAAIALSEVQNTLSEKNLCLRVYDGYRPQRAVNHFKRWARNINDTLNKAQYYPSLSKRELFLKQYIASRSGHSRGSTVDLTIIDGSTNEELDMGSPYDFFGEISWVNSPLITKQQQSNRNLLQEVMKQHGFRGYSKEWWHFTLRNEPHPNIYFDFVIF